MEKETKHTPTEFDLAREIVKKIPVNRANFEHIAVTGKINGSLMASICDLIIAVKGSVCAKCGGTGIIGNGPTSFNPQACSCLSAPSLQSEIDRLKEENYRLQKALDGARQSISDMKNPLKRRKF